MILNFQLLQFKTAQMQSANSNAKTNTQTLLDDIIELHRSGIDKLKPKQVFICQVPPFKPVPKIALANKRNEEFNEAISSYFEEIDNLHLIKFNDVPVKVLGYEKVFLKMYILLIIMAFRFTLICYFSIFCLILTTYQRTSNNRCCMLHITAVKIVIIIKTNKIVQIGSIQTTIIVPIAPPISIHALL